MNGEPLSLTALNLTLYPVGGPIQDEWDHHRGVTRPHQAHLDILRSLSQSDPPAVERVRRRYTFFRGSPGTRNWLSFLRWRQRRLTIRTSKGSPCHLRPGRKAQGRSGTRSRVR